MPDSANPFSFGAPIPAILWISLEEAMKTNMRRLAKDIASTLAQPEQPLMDALFKGKEAVIRPYLFEEADEDKDIDMRCSVICQRPDAPLFLQQCGRPVFWDATKGAGPHRCTRHLFTAPVLRPRLPDLFPLLSESEELEEPLWHMSTGEVVDAENRPRGVYDKERKRLVLFEMPPATAGDEEST